MFRPESIERTLIKNKINKRKTSIFFQYTEYTHSVLESHKQNKLELIKI